MSVLHLYQRLVSVCVYESVFNMQSVLALGRGMAGGRELRATAEFRARRMTARRICTGTNPSQDVTVKYYFDSVSSRPAFFIGRLGGL